MLNTCVNESLFSSYINHPQSEFSNTREYIECIYYGEAFFDIYDLFFSIYPALDIKLQNIAYKAKILMENEIYLLFSSWAEKDEEGDEYEYPVDDDDIKTESDINFCIEDAFEKNLLVIPEPPGGLKEPQLIGNYNRGYYHIRSLWDLAHITYRENFEDRMQLCVQCETLNDGRYNNCRYEFAPVSTGEVFISEKVFYVEDIKKWIQITRRYISF